MSEPSFKKHGHWVRLKGSDREGRIAFYDTTEKLVWVLWEVGSYIMNGHKFKQKVPGASGHKPQELVLTPFEPSPWIREELTAITN